MVLCVLWRVLYNFDTCSNADLLSSINIFCAVDIQVHNVVVINLFVIGSKKKKKDTFSEGSKKRGVAIRE